MFAIPGILLLLLFIYLRPQEYVPILKTLPLLYLFLGLTIFGFVVDWRLRRTRPLAVPQLGWVVLFIGWLLFGVVVRDPSHFVTAAIDLAIAFALFALIGHGVQSFRAFQALTGMVLVMAIFLSVVAVHQGMAPLGCFAINSASNDGGGVYDGRSCEKHRECYADDPEPGVDYMCERVGLFGTSSIGGRVRFRGKLNDPNELAMVIGVALPFAVAFVERKRSTARTLLALGTFALGLLAAMYTQSRGGQLVFLTVVAAYFVRRMGWKGLIWGGLFALPVLMFGGRSGDEAESSSEERIRCWYEGMSMVRDYFGIGVGHGQFVEHHTQTAHNSYILSAAETGFPGFHFWSIVMYISMKIPVTALRRLGAPDGGEADVARTWAMALIASWTGFLVGIFFLSFSYHQILWIFVGLNAAFYSAMKTHDEGFEAKFGWRDWFLVLAIDVGLIAMLFAYTRYKAP